MMKGKKVFVTGGSGLVGSNLVKKLDRIGADVHANYLTRKPDFLLPRFEKADLTDLDQCLHITKDMEFVVLSAGQTFGAKILNERPTDAILPNVQINANMLEACRKNKVARVLFLSSGTIYPLLTHPIREDELDLNVPPYELYKAVGGVNRFIETLCRFYYDRYGLAVGIIRIANVYGPHDRFDPERSHVLPALIRRALAKENPFVVWGNHATVRDFLYAEDLADDIVKILSSDPVTDPINVGSGQGITIGEAVSIVLDVCGHKISPTYDTSKPTAIPHRVLDTGKFAGLFGKPKRTTLVDGIQKTTEWYTRVCLN